MVSSRGMRASTTREIAQPMNITRAPSGVHVQISVSMCGIPGPSMGDEQCGYNGICAMAVGIATQRDRHCGWATRCITSTRWGAQIWPKSCARSQCRWVDLRGPRGMAQSRGPRKRLVRQASRYATGWVRRQMANRRRGRGLLGQFQEPPGVRAQNTLDFAL